MRNLVISQFILSIAVFCLAIGLILNSYADIKRSKQIRCLEFGMVYIKNEFCVKH